MTSVASIIILGVLPIISTAPVLEEGTLWILGENNSSDEASVALLIGAETSYSSFSCNEHEDGVYRDLTSCTLHYRCTYGRREVYKCLDGYLFNPETLRCEEESNVTCTDIKNPCKMLGDGLYANYSSSCQDYYRCENRVLKNSYSCGSGYAFSIVAQGCVLAKEVICVQPHCATSGSGFYIIPGTGCRAYYHCFRGIRTDYVCPQDSTYSRQKKVCVQNKGICYEPLCTGRVNGRYPDTSHNCERSFECSGGVIQAVHSCSPGRLYNGHACLPSDNVICQPPETTAVAVHTPTYNPCSMLPDGPHPTEDPDIECRTYILCKGGQKVETLRCPVGQRFNGRHCADASKMLCLSDCTSRPNGYYADLMSGCQNYFYCMEGQTTEVKTCTEGTVYNGHMCIPSQFFTCPLFSLTTNINKSNKCNSKEDGFHTDYGNNCKGYYYCSEGKVLLEGSCIQNQVWNGKTCVEQEELLCKGPEPWSGCIGMEEGLYQDYSSNCHYYYYCKNGNRTLLSCSQGEVFDGKSCVSAEMYKCAILEPDICNQKDDGYYVDPDSNCRSYYYCSNGHKITYVCPGSFVFNGKECVDPSNYECPYNSMECFSHSNGYHYDIDSGCRKYFYCLDRNKITTLTCADNKIFDGRRCVEPSGFNCPDSSSNNNLCAFQPDGLIPHVASGCQSYILCKDQKQMSVSNCPDGRIFDGSSCVDVTNEDLCNHLTINPPPSPSPDCMNMPNAFYQNYTTGCHSYFYCIDGMKTTLTCPGNEVFNGQLCVDSDSYSCPSPPRVPANPCLSNSSRDETMQKEREVILHIFPPT